MPPCRGRLFIYVKNSAARRPEVAQFVKYYLENIDKFAVKGGYDPPTAEDKAANQEALAKLLIRGGAEAKAAAKPASRARRSLPAEGGWPQSDRNPRI